MNIHNDSNLIFYKDAKIYTDKKTVFSKIGIGKTIYPNVDKKLVPYLPPYDNLSK